jgi:hypothetical protein
MSYSFRVSDSAAMPNHGHLLRLKVASGTPRMKELRPGTRVRVAGPHGEAAVVDVVRHATVGGQATQERLERTHELDIVIPAHQAWIAGVPIGIGWTVVPAQAED